MKQFELDVSVKSLYNDWQYASCRLTTPAGCPYVIDCMMKILVAQTLPHYEWLPGDIVMVNDKVSSSVGKALCVVLGVQHCFDFIRLNLICDYNNTFLETRTKYF